jgi:hypothetical protein
MVFSSMPRLGVVDAGVVILGPVEDDGLALEGLGIVRIRGSDRRTRRRSRWSS